MGDRNLYVLLVSVFLFSTGFGIMTPAVPLYATLTFEANQWELGLLGALAAFPYIFAPALLGRFSDRRGRKPLIFAGLLLYSATSLFYMAASSLEWLASLRVLEGLSFALIWPTTEALVGDKSPLGSRSWAVGLYCVAWSAGYMVGPFIYGSLLPLIGLIYSFIIPSLLMLASLSLMVFVSADRQETEENQEQAPPSRLSFKVILYTMVIWGFASLSFFFLFPAYAGIYQITPVLIAYLIGLVCLMRTLVFLVYRRLRALRTELVVPLGMILLSLGMLATWGAPGLVGFIISACLLGLSLGLLYVYSLVHTLNRPSRGLNAGLFESSIGIGQFLGPITMGILGFSLTPSSPYLFLGILAAGSALLTIRAVWRS